MRRVTPWLVIALVTFVVGAMAGSFMAHTRAGPSLCEGDRGTSPIWDYRTGHRPTGPITTIPLVCP